MKLQPACRGVHAPADEHRKDQNGFVELPPLRYRRDAHDHEPAGCESWEEVEHLREEIPTCKLHGKHTERNQKNPAKDFCIFKDLLHIPVKNLEYQKYVHRTQECK